MKHSKLLFLLIFMSNVRASFQTIHQARVQLHDMLATAIVDDAQHQEQAALLIQEAFDRFYFANPETVHIPLINLMLKAFHGKFNTSPFPFFNAPARHKACVLEQENSVLQKANQELKQAVEQERQRAERLTHDIEQQVEKQKVEQKKEEQVAVVPQVPSTTVPENTGMVVPENATPEQKVTAVVQSYQHELQALMQYQELARKEQEKLQQRICDLERYPPAFKQVKAQRDEALNKLKDMQRQADADRAALNEACAQRDAAQKQLHDFKKQVKDDQGERTRAQQRERDVKTQLDALQRQLLSERIAYDGALDDERSQRLKVRQQMQELTQRLTTDRMVYQSRVVSLEQELAALKDQMKSGIVSGNS